MNKFNPGDRCEVHIKSIDRWRSATILTTYPGHGGHMVITDGGQRLHAKRGDLRATTHYTPGETVEVRSKEGSFWVAGIFERWVDDTHQQALVRDGSPWPDTVTADPFHVSNIRHKAPTPDPHGTAYQGEVGDHQPQYTDNGDGTGEVSIEIFPKLRTMFIGRDEYRHLDNSNVYRSDPNYGRDTKGTFTKPRATEPCAPLQFVSYNPPAKTPKELAEDRAYDALRKYAATRPMGPVTLSTLKYGHVATEDELSMRTPENAPPIVPQETMFKETMRRLGINTGERDGYLEAILEFAKAGISPNTVNSYVAALGRFDAYGFTPADLERITTDKIRENIAGHPAHDTLPNITAEYRGTR